MTSASKQRSFLLPQAWPILVAVGFVGLTVYPVVFDRRDSFPLSTYPMFARPRGNPQLVKLVALTNTGEQVSVPPELLGTNEVLQAKAQLNQIAQKGGKTRKRFCRAVAERVAREPSLHWQELQLQRVRYNPIEYFESDGTPLELELLERCAVGAAATPPDTSPAAWGGDDD